MIKREPHRSVRQPFRVGVVLDWPDAQVRRDALDTLRFCFDEALAARRIDRPVELLVRELDGPPAGSALDVAAAWRGLARDERVQIVLGPHTDDAALAVAQAMRELKLPTVSACNVSGFSSDFGVTLGLGNAADEAVLLADLHAARGHRVAVLAELSASGDEALASFGLHAREAGVAVVEIARVEPAAEPAAFGPLLASFQARGATSVQVLAGPASLAAVGSAAARIAASDTAFRPQYAMGTGFAAHRLLSEAERSSLDGWIGLDVLDDRNAVASGFLDRFASTKGRRPAHAWSLIAHDLAQVGVHALANGKPPSPEGLRTALDRLRFWPAAVGSPGTSISVAPYDHRAYKGPYLVLREIRGGTDRLLDVPTRFAA